MAVPRCSSFSSSNSDALYSSFLNGITVGEYIYGIYEVFNELTNEAACPAEDPLYKEAILYSTLESLAHDFLDRFRDGYFDEETAIDVWELWKACRANQEPPLWADDNDKSIEPPKLHDLKTEDWEYILEMIQEEFFWDLDFEYGANFALLEPQPHWPNFQEFRTAKTWLLGEFERTRASRKAREEANRKKADKPATPERKGKRKAKGDNNYE